LQLLQVKQAVWKSDPYPAATRFWSHDIGVAQA
jgi:hypothetical protein